MKWLKKITQTNHETNKTYKYTRNKVGLSFTLRSDIKQEMKDFLELLKQAQEEVEKDINEF